MQVDWELVSAIKTKAPDRMFFKIEPYIGLRCYQKLFNEDMQTVERVWDWDGDEWQLAVVSSYERGGIF